MFKKYYVLKSGDFYLTDINYKYNKIEDFKLEKEYKHIFADFEIAEDIRKEIYIETGLNLEVKLFKEVEDETI